MATRVTSASFTVVLVTDDPLYGARLRRAFIRSARGVCLFLAGTGATKLSPVQARAFPQPHVILVDLDANGKHAEATLRWLRKDRQLANVPIVMLGAEDQNDVIAAGYSAGANACVLKPLAEDAMNEIAANIGDYAYLLQVRPDAALIEA